MTSTDDTNSTNPPAGATERARSVCRRLNLPEDGVAATLIEGAINAHAAELERERDAALAQNRKLRGADGRIADLCILVNKLAYALHVVQLSRQHDAQYPSLTVDGALSAARAMGWAATEGAPVAED